MYMCAYIYIYVFVYVGAIVNIVGNGYGNPRKIQDETVCISHSVNTLGKGMNPITHQPSMGE